MQKKKKKKNHRCKLVSIFEHLELEGTCEVLGNEKQFAIECIPICDKS